MKKKKRKSKVAKSFWYEMMQTDMSTRWLGKTGWLGKTAKQEANEIEEQQGPYILFFLAVFFGYVFLTWLCSLFGVNIWIFT